MKPKQILFVDDARDMVRRGMETLAETGRVSLEPRGRTTLLDRGFGAPQIVHSGVMAARSVALEDRFENMGAVSQLHPEGGLSDY